MRIDLHTHSTCSDGTEPAEQVVAVAARAGLDVIALTDHDTTAGWAAAESAARQHGVQVVPGMELSCEAAGVGVHLLSYLHDPMHPGLAGEAELARGSRDARARRMVELLSRQVPITWADVQAQVSQDATVGRPHIADALVARGLVRDREEAFAGLLSSRGPCYVRYYAVDAVRAVRLVVEAGGVPVLAHPRAEQRGEVVDDGTVEELVDAGLAGLEVWHRDHDDDARRYLTRLADRWGLLSTGSSDYHGSGKPNRLGEHTTDPDVFQEIVDRSASVEPAGGSPVDA
ncbi:MAG: PHP domain-containing protein [Angustibacter sp.]